MIMATPLQLEANRCNSQKSTGPRTPEGKAVTRFNALKTGIHAQSHVIPGEDAAELAELADGYHQQFHPATPAERFLIDTLVASEWQLRRLHKAEAQLWERELNQLSKTPEGAQERFPLAYVFSREIFARMHRCVQAAERSYFRALKELTRLQAASEDFFSDPDLASFRTSETGSSLPVMRSADPFFADLAGSSQDQPLDFRRNPAQGT